MEKKLSLHCFRIYFFPILWHEIWFVCNILIFFNFFHFFSIFVNQNVFLTFQMMDPISIIWRTIELIYNASKNKKLTFWMNQIHEFEKVQEWRWLGELKNLCHEPVHKFSILTWNTVVLTKFLRRLQQRLYLQIWNNSLKLWLPILRKEKPIERCM